MHRIFKCVVIRSGADDALISQVENSEALRSTSLDLAPWFPMLPKFQAVLRLGVETIQQRD